MKQMLPAVKTILSECFNLQKSETFLIITDTPCSTTAYSFYSLSAKLHTKISFFILPTINKKKNFKHLSALIPAITQHAACLIMTSTSLSHTPMRRIACREGVRIISMPAVSFDVITRNKGGLNPATEKLSKKIADILSIGSRATLTTPAGTRLTFSLKNRKGYADSCLVHAPGRFSNFPAGEACAAPSDKSVNGTLIIDGSFPGVGLMNEPVKMLIKNGSVSRIYGNKEAVIIRKMIRPFGKTARIIAEVGIGTNCRARLKGCTVEDEKVKGLVHVALGDNTSFGGTNASGCHYDAVIRRPTLTIDSRTILEQGKIHINS